MPLRGTGGGRNTIAQPGKPVYLISAGSLSVPGWKPRHHYPSRVRTNHRIERLRMAGDVNLRLGNWTPVLSHSIVERAVSATCRRKPMLDIKRYYSKLPDAPCVQRAVFHHMAKCGGTSVSYALRRCYLLSYAGFLSEPIYQTMETLNPDATQMELIDRVRNFRQQLLLQHLFSDIRCIYGHADFSEAAYNLFNQSYAFITTLRDPVNCCS